MAARKDVYMLLQGNEIGFRLSVSPVIAFSLLNPAQNEHRYSLSYEVIIMHHLPIIKHVYKKL